ncbi:MAG: T9SS type A sorting domain-containing protein, partial [Ignavibacteriaceae bacterium]|nr:T9SS type A sorting domain-containing protein [Ignavibacteriaceae bacterium]
NNIIANIQATTGQYDWIIPPQMVSEECIIRICDTSNPAICDQSNNVFSIQSNANIMVNTPNGGESWVLGTIEDIKWFSENIVDVKIELSLNNGVTWNTIVDSIGSTGIYSWEVQAASSSIQCLIRISDLATNVFDRSDGIFEIEVGTGVDKNFNGIPSDYVLIQNYPNPFNPSTRIYFGVPEPTFVVIVVYDMLGNELEKLVSDKKDAGYYEVSFDASKYNSGIYFYRIQSGDFVETKKMVLMK